MKTFQRYLHALVVLFGLLAPTAQLAAQGTAFTYQGRLNDGANGASGSYDLRFTLFDAAGGGTQQGNALTNAATTISNGLFTVLLDFGNQFPGADRWLEIAVRTNGGGAFTALVPRQLLTPTPYAIFSAGASSVAAANITGTISTAQLPGTVVTNGASGVSFSGTFTGNGAGVSNVLLTALNAPGILSWPGNYALTSSPDVGNGPRSVTAADVNGDGRLDLISANTSANTLSVLTNNGSGVFGLLAIYNSGNNPRSVVASDVNGDGKPDLIATSQSPGSLLVLTNNGSGGFVAASTNSTGPGGGNVQMVIAADINSDGKPDLISANGSTIGTLSVFTNNGSGGFVTPIQYSVGNNPFAVTAADLNNDGKLDLISANNNASGTVSRLLNDGSGGFLAAVSFNAGNGPRSVAAADVNGDGFQDLICANVVDNTLSVLTNNGSASFPAATPVSVGSSPVWVTAVDLNSDGKVDLISANNVSLGTLTAVTNNGSGGFVSAFTNGVGSTPYVVIAADVNADGRVDLVSANGVTPGTLSVLFNLPSFNGVFTGGGERLTLNASQLTSGQVPVAVLSNAWKTTGNGGTTAGTHFLGTTDNQALELKANGTRALRLEPTASGAPNVIGGAPNNFVGASLVGATISGGGAANYLGSSYTNSVTVGDFGTVGGGYANTSSGLGTVSGGRSNTSSGFTATVGGGQQNTSSSLGATVGGGYQNTSSALAATVSGGHHNTSSGTSATVGGGAVNTSSGDHATVGGGQSNTSSTNSATVGGGQENTAGGQYSTVPGGSVNAAAGDFSFAAGRRAKATNQGAFVWGDSTDADIASTLDNSWTIRAGGGYRFFSNTNAAAGVFLAAGGTSWSVISDRNAKKNFHSVDVAAVLEKLARVPVQQWNYQWESDQEVPHLGPMAQDFKPAFYPGRDEKSITTQEIDGVALAAIQGLNEKVEVRGQQAEARIQQLETENTELKQRLEKLERFMNEKSGGVK